MLTLLPSLWHRPPIPSEQELERRFNEVLIQMDLPPERAKILKGFSNEKKWDTVCDHDLVHAKAGGGGHLRAYIRRSRGGGGSAQNV
jgi:hypothetical protein